MDPAVDDGRDDGFGGAKADGARIDEGSAAAIGVLRVANQATGDVLTAEVGLSRRATEGILAGRPFATLAALDAVPWVGPRSLERLAAYAEAQGFVPLVVGPLSVEGSCHETTKTYADNDGSCRVTFRERDLRVDIALSVAPVDGVSTVRITSMRDVHDVAQYLCRVVTGSGCPATMAAPITVPLDGGWVHAGAVQLYAATAGEQLELQLAIDGDRRELWCRGVVVHAWCTATVPLR
jgi:hypothetical protein